MRQKKNWKIQLSQETQKMLRRIYVESRKPQVSQRAHCLLLMEKGYEVKQLVEIFSVSRKTIYNWRSNWVKEKLVGLYNRPGRGRKETFDSQQKESIKAWVKENPKNLGRVLEKIQEAWKIKTSKDTLKRILKCAGMKWKRVRRGVGGQPEREIYQRRKQILKTLEKLSDQGSINIRYLDETGFCLTPYVPYAWQDKEGGLEIESQPSQRINVVGLLSRANELDSFIFKGSITSQIVIEVLDWFAQKLDKLTVVVLDNAPIHRSKALQEKIPQWREQKLELFWLPTYSPQLNLIEILWRFIKYEWIELDAYSSWSNLLGYVEKVLKGFGDDYVINFA